jgi:hypothetical protein
VHALLPIGLLCIAVIVVGDLLLLRVLRSRYPAAFAAVGSPALAKVALLSPALSARYYRFILRREFRHHLRPRTGAYYLANLLYVANIVLIGTVMLFVGISAWSGFR